MKQIIATIYLILLACAGHLAAQGSRIMLTQLERGPLIDGSRQGLIGLTNANGDQRYAFYVNVADTCVLTTPTPTGNTVVSIFVQKCATDSIWYIDWEGRSILLAPYGGAGSCDVDWLEISDNSCPDAITDSLYKYKYASIGARYVWPGSELLVNDSSSAALVVIQGSRNARLAVRDLINETWTMLDHGGSTPYFYFPVDADFVFSTASGTPQSPSIQTRHFSINATDSTIQMHQYPDTRRDTNTVNNFLYTDNTGKIRSQSVDSIAGGDGIYGGSDIIPDGTVATIPDFSTFSFRVQSGATFQAGDYAGDLSGVGLKVEETQVGFGDIFGASNYYGYFGLAGNYLRSPASDFNQLSNQTLWYINEGSTYRFVDTRTTKTGVEYQSSSYGPDFTDSTLVHRAYVEQMISDSISTSADHGVINARDYGATGNGVTDDLTALQNAINAAVGQRLWIPDGTYYISAQLSVPGNSEIIFSPDATLDISSWAPAVSAGSARALDVSGTAAAPVSITANIAVGATSITVTSTAGFTVGSVVEIQSTEPLHTGYANRYKGYLSTVDSIVSGTVLRLSNASYFSIDVSTYTATVRQYTPAENVKIRNGTILCGGVGKGQVGIYATYTRNLLIDNMTITNAETEGVWLGQSMTPTVSNCQITGCTSPTYLGVTYGYGVGIGSAVHGANVSGCYFENCRHSVSGGGATPAMYAVVEDNNTFNCGRSTQDLDCHESTIGFRFSNNSSQAGPTGSGGIVIRGTDAVVEGNEINGGTIVISNSETITGSTLGRTTLTGNVIRNTTVGIQTSNLYLNDIVIEGGLIENTSAEGIKLSTTTRNVKIQGVSFVTIGTACIYAANANGLNITNCTFQGCQYGVDITSTSANVLISNCVASSCTDNFVRTYITRNVTISNCVGAGMTNSSGIYFNRSNNCTVSNTLLNMSNATYDGIRAWGSVATANNIRAMGCTVTGTFGYGLNCFSNSDTITAIGNNFQAAATAQITAPNATVVNIIGQAGGNIGLDMDGTYGVVATATVSNTNTAPDRLTIKTNSSGSATTSFGGSILFQGESSTTNNRDMGRINSVWTTATDASREAKIGFQLGDNGGALSEIANFNTSGSSTGQLSVGSTNAVTLQNSSLTTGAAFVVGNSSSSLTLGNGTGSVIVSSGATATAAIDFQLSTVASSATAGIRFLSGSVTQTSGTRNMLNIATGFAPTSGTAVHNQLTFDGTFNQTGGANGITRGIYLNQTLTAVADFRALEIAANGSNSYGLYQSGSSTKNYLNGNTGWGDTSPETLVDITGTSATQHLIGQDLTPTISVNTGGAGTGASASMTNAQSSDIAGRFSITSGTGATTGLWATITFDDAFTVTPIVQVYNEDSDASNLKHYVNVSTTGFEFFINGGQTDGTVYEFNFIIIGGK